MLKLKSLLRRSTRASFKASTARSLFVNVHPTDARILDKVYILVENKEGLLIELLLCHLAAQNPGSEGSCS